MREGMGYQWWEGLISGAGTLPFKPYFPIWTHTSGIQEDGDLSPDIDEKSLAYPLLLLKTLIIFSFCIIFSFI